MRCEPHQQNKTQLKNERSFKVSQLPINITEPSVQASDLQRNRRQAHIIGKRGIQKQYTRPEDGGICRRIDSVQTHTRIRLFLQVLTTLPMPNHLHHFTAARSSLPTPTTVFHRVSLRSSTFAGGELVGRLLVLMD